MYAILFELVTYSMFLVQGRIEFFGRTVFPVCQAGPVGELEN